MSSVRSVYPDVSDILERKERGRSNLAALPFHEKIRILEAMRDRDETIRRAREARQKLDAAHIQTEGARRRP